MAIYICPLFIVVVLTSGASPLFWYLLLCRLLILFVDILTSEASPFSRDFILKVLSTLACNGFIAYRKVGKYLSFGFFSYVLLFIYLFLSTYSNVLNASPLGLLFLNAQFSEFGSARI